MASNSQFRVVVIGGGISGLAAAFHLGELAESRKLPLDVTLLERSARVGSALQTIRKDGFIAETGVDSFLAEKPWAVALANRLHLDSELIGTNERFRTAYVVRKGRLVAVPEGFALLAPTRIGALVKTPLFSVRGKLRMASELLVPRKQGDEDESLASFVIRRFGRETFDRVAQPLAGGIHSSDPARLSIKATMPRFPELEQRYGSVIRGLWAAQKMRAKQAAGAAGNRFGAFVSFKDGVQTLVDALATRLAGRIRLGAEAVALSRGPDGAGWRVHLDDAHLDADAVICAAPSFAAARLLRSHDPLLGERLDGISYSSAVTVNIAFSESDFSRLPPSLGFVVPALERRRIIAATFSSLKFAGRAPQGAVMTRAFLGGTLHDQMMQLDDAAMVAVVREEFRDLLGVTAEPRFSYVQRWPDSMPEYVVGHLDRVAEIERRVAALAGMSLAGSAYHAVGVPDCVHSGEQAAEAVFSYLTSSASRRQAETSAGKLEQRSQA
ncbi:MAG TPA: protoporphyrinogen oxidase [Candidatus Binataceae bacterium]|nr:protoporphyrinogen oxidase [Candidatus Binataceae bacterium]